jgi:predicted DNA-binding protein (MmcQ/YjbR family)
MTTRKEITDHCLEYADVYEDDPFHDPNWRVIRHRKSKKIFAWIFERNGNIWVNLKCEPQWTAFWRSAFSAVVPAYHLNKTHWNSVILDGSIPREDICRMVAESYELTKPAPRRK